MKKTVALTETYNREPCFGGQQTGWAVAVYLDGNQVGWKEYTFSKKHIAIDAVKTYIGLGYKFAWQSHEHWLIAQELNIEAGE